MSPLTVSGEILHQDNFDLHEDWTINQPIAPFAATAHQGEESILDGYHSYYIAGSYYTDIGNNSLILNQFNHRGVSGKGLTFWNESDTRGDGWASDNQLGVYLPEGYDELYARFYIKFQPGWRWTHDGESEQKLARFTHYHGGSPFQYFEGGNQHPIAGLHIAKYNSGDGNACFQPIFRYEHVYFPDLATPPHPRAQVVYPGSANYNGTGEDFTESTEWNCWEIRVKMNSAPGVADGIYQFWVNEVLIFSITDLAWSDTGAQASPRLNWNYFLMGGNSFNHFADNTDEEEQWYAIDDLVIGTEYIGPGLDPSEITGSEKDVNGDGNVTIEDVTMCVNVILGKISDSADVNHDGRTNIQDVTAVVNEIIE